MAPRIRSMRPSDVAPATAAILAADWGDRRSWFEFTLSQDSCHPFVAELDDRIVGSGVAIRSGRAGWVGTIWVAPDQRGRGLGRALTEATISALNDAGVRTLVLVATQEGRPLYERMGFEVADWYEILEAGGTEAAPPPAVRPFRAADLPRMCELDAAATGEDRASVLERFATSASARVVTGDGDEVRGFVIRAPWGGGATIATDAEDAMRLLDARRAAAGPGGRVRVGVLRSNATGLERLEAAGLRRIWSAPRLVRGASLTWRPDWIWGQFNHAMG
jgi:ribosomal protein S18 acetylase RimI-like enzyme